MYRKARHRLVRLIQDISLRTKMNVIFSILLLLPFGAFTFYSANRITDALKEQTLASAYKAFYEAATNLNTNAQNAIEVSELLSYDELVYRCLLPDPVTGSYSQQLDDTRSLISKIDNLELLSGVENVKLYVDDKLPLLFDRRIFLPLSDLSSLPKYNTFSYHHTQQWFSPADYAKEEDDAFSCMRMIYQPNALTMPLAILRVDLSSADVRNALHGSSTAQRGIVLLLDQSSVLLSAGESDRISPSEDDISSILLRPTESWSEINVADEACYIYRLPLSLTDWQLVTIIPQREIYAPSSLMRNELIIVSLLLVMIALFCSVIISHFLIRRIRSLTTAMQEVEGGRTEIRQLSESNDEVGILIHHFNRMMAHIRELLDEQMRHGIEIKNLELKALQAQINPHFLYNTLDTINSLAFEKDSPEIRELVNALATFYRISLSKGANEISLRDEISHAKAYVNIQSMRFPDQITVNWNIPEDIQDQMIIKIVLQPIIENAIIHGIFEKEDSRGTILVSCTHDNNSIQLCVEDDGVGISRELINQLFNTDASSARTTQGYGISNINDRLKIAYGESFGLSCTSIPGEGTKVQILIPYMDHGVRHPDA